MDALLQELQEALREKVEINGQGGPVFAVAPATMVMASQNYKRVRSPSPLPEGPRPRRVHEIAAEIQDLVEQITKKYSGEVLKCRPRSLPEGESRRRKRRIRTAHTPEHPGAPGAGATAAPMGRTTSSSPWWARGQRVERQRQRGGAQAWAHRGGSGSSQRSLGGVGRIVDGLPPGREGSGGSELQGFSGKSVLQAWKDQREW